MLDSTVVCVGLSVVSGGEKKGSVVWATNPSGWESNNRNLVYIVTNENGFSQHYYNQNFVCLLKSAFVEYG